MKNIWIFILLLVLTSCQMRKSEKDTKTIQTNRIIIKEKIFHEGVAFYIIEVDSVEYITSYKGGIYPLVK